MGRYSEMSGFYDVIMTSGYYDYPKIVDGLINGHPVANVLELGCGTGLIIEELAKRRPQIAITGVDLTPEMLAIAQDRLSPFANVKLFQQNVCELDLHAQHDLVFSYGGVWYFVVQKGHEPFMVSHIADHEDNLKGLEKLAACIAPGGRLMLGTQGPHFNYERPISNGMVYSQVIEPTEIGFTKHYFLDDGARRVMSQTIHYRTYTFAQACDMLKPWGIEFDGLAHHHDEGGMFMGFSKS